MSHSKGFARERELVNLLYEAGWGATRVPNSGGGTKRELPDVLAGNGQDSYAIEVKARKDGHIYIDGQEIVSLAHFARSFGAKPRIGVRFDREDWVFFHPADLHVTNGGNYRVKKETALARRANSAELTGQSRKVTLDQIDPAPRPGDGAATREVLKRVAAGGLSVDEALAEMM